MTKEESEMRADAVLAEMRGGSICDVTPERSRRIVAEALRGAEERGRTLGEPGDEAAAVRAVLRVGMKRTDGAPMSEDESQLAAVLEARTSAARTTAFLAGKKAGAAEEREACALEAERALIEYSEIDTLDKTPERFRIAARIRARGAALPTVADLMNAPHVAAAVESRVRAAPPLPSPSEVEAVTRRADAAAQAFVAHVFTGPKSTEGMSAEEVEAAKAREREEFPLRMVRPMGVPTSPAELAQVRAFLARHDPGGAIGLPDDHAFEYIEAGSAAAPPCDEPFPWDAPAEGFGVATLGDPPSPPLAGYPVNRITSERREHVRAFLARDLGGLTRLPDDAAIDFEAGTVKP